MPTCGVQLDDEIYGHEPSIMKRGRGARRECHAPARLAEFTPRLASEVTFGPTQSDLEFGLRGQKADFGVSQTRYGLSLDRWL